MMTSLDPGGPRGTGLKTLSDELLNVLTTCPFSGEKKSLLELIPSDPSNNFSFVPV